MIGGLFCWRNGSQAYEHGKDAESCHCHILIQFDRVKRSNILAKELISANKNCEVDVRKKQGSWEEARNYILKQDDTKIKGRNTPGIHKKRQQGG